VPEVPIKKHPTIACCGIDCGLCPRYYTDGASRCPGCAGEGFAEKHPSCPIVTCCVVKRSLETCAGCGDFPCGRMMSWDGGDSFVTHRVCLSNLRAIRADGLAAFLKTQRRRMKALGVALERHDDGRSKSFFCLAAALLPVDALERAVREAGTPTTDRKQAARLLREAFTRIAAEHGLAISYRRG
jgi:hypothetical protein